VKMDPRVKTSVAGLQKKFQAETKLAALLTQTSQALLQGSSIRTQLDKLNATASAETKNAIADFQKKLTALLGAPGGFFAPPSPEPTLSRINGEASTLYQQVWQVDAEPTSAQVEALDATEHNSADVLNRWSEFNRTDLPALNRVLRESQIPEIHVQADLKREESGVDEE